MKGHVFIAGGGHAGVEAAFAVSRMGLSCTIVSMDLSATARMSCNPAIGGLAKSHLVKEIDALGGVMPVAADYSAVQFKTLNLSKGPAVQSLRIQTDKKKYPRFVQSLIAKNKNISMLEGEVVSFKTTSGAVSSFQLSSGENIPCSSLIITSGTFLNGRIHIGNKSFKAGRLGESSSVGLTECLKNHEFKTSRLKTGTPPRLLKSSINWDLCFQSPPDKECVPFSLFRSGLLKTKNSSSFFVKTNEKVHKKLLNNLENSPMYSGKIDAAGPRYCPSVEDKVVRFKDRKSHLLFLETEWKGSNQVYLSGFSTSMPKDIQVEALQKIPAFKNVSLIRPGYAIEYDFIPTYQLKNTLESKKIDGLFFAGQINGTSGYEEAAAQGLIAGINSALYVLKKRPFIMKRTDGYIGVLIDDLVTKIINEPYRMFTSQSEFRLSLRPDNVYDRIMPLAFKQNLITKKYYDLYINYRNIYKKYMSSTSSKIRTEAFSGTLKDYIKRPGSSLSDFLCAKKPVEKHALFGVETDIKYSGYIKIEKQRAKKIESLESSKIPKNINYKKIKTLSSESREKLSVVLPETIGQAQRIFGVSRSDISNLCIYVSEMLKT